MAKAQTGHATSIAEDVVVLLVRASGAALRRANAALEPFGLRARHYAAVRIAADTPGGAPQRRIGMLLGLDPSAVVALVDDLEAAELVQRQPDPEDRRTRLVSVTPAGLRLLDRVGDIVSEVRDEVLAPLEPGERELFLAALATIVG